MPIRQGRRAESVQASLAGQLRDFEVPQVVSLLEYARMTGTLEIAAPAGAGRLFFQQGQLAGAEAGEERGELAAYVLVSRSEGVFKFTREAVVEPQEPMRSNQSLVLEAARLLDESSNSSVSFARVVSGAPDQVRNGTRRVFRALDGTSSVGAVASALGCSPLEALYHLEKLERLGAVARCSGPEAPTGGAFAVATGTGRRIRVLVVDDSALMQKVLVRLYESDPGFEVVGTAANGTEALELLVSLRPDLVSLDLFMPVMDGPATLKRIMMTQPTPTVVVTSASPEALELTFESILRYGAIDFITKPSRSRGDLDEQTRLILSRARKAARADLRGLRMVQPPVEPPRVRAGRVPCQGVVVAAAGTGGGLSMMQLLTGLPADLPCAVIGTLPLPDDFLGAFVSFMRKSAPFDVEVAEDGARVQGGVCYLGGSDRDVRLVQNPTGVSLSVTAPGPFSSVGPLMMDAARFYGSRSAAIVLSGEGDGALVGLATIRAEGGITLAQLPTTCVDPEQSERAIAAGLVDRVVLASHLSGSLSQLHLSRSRQGVTKTPPEEVCAPWPERNA
jgi:two-component system chemotaxis response regulator CheB